MNNCKLYIIGLTLEQADEFVCLGNMFNKDGEMDEKYF